MSDFEHGLSLRAGTNLAGITDYQVWGRYICLGGNDDCSSVAAHINDQAACNPHQHDLIAQVLNEYLLDRGHDWPVAYALPADWANPYL